MQQEQFSNLQETGRHGDFMLPFAQYVSWLPGSFTLFPMHWHNEVEIVYVENGYCEFNVDLERYVVKQGDIVIVKPYSLHAIKQYKEESGCLFSFVFDVNMLSYGGMDACYVKYLKPFIDGKFEYPQVIGEECKGYEELKAGILELHKVNDAKEPIIEMNIKWRLERLFYL